MLINNEERIQNALYDLQKSLVNEEKQNNGYDVWWENTSEFRDSLKHYLKLNLFNKTYREKIIILPDGNMVDHHIISYFAPYDFCRKGWDHEKSLPSIQIIKLGKFFQERGKRFIYVPLPNKGVIYPEIISNIKVNCSYNSPQWRKMIKEVVRAGIEVIDAFSIYKNQKRNGNIFSLGHHISSYGARLIAKYIAEYVKYTTKIDFQDETFDIWEEIQDWNYLDMDYATKDHFYREKLYMHFVRKNDQASPYTGGFSDQSPIAIFGDCNLQNYEIHGAGILANLSYFLGFPVDNVGRKLPFDWKDSFIDETIKRLLTKDIIIYVAFASAAFVRSSRLSYKRLGIPYTWSTLDLEKY